MRKYICCIVALLSYVFISYITLQRQWTKLHEAASTGELQAAKDLIGTSADINAQDRWVHKPLPMALPMTIQQLHRPAPLCSITGIQFIHISIAQTSNFRSTSLISHPYFCSCAYRMGTPHCTAQPSRATWTY